MADFDYAIISDNCYPYCINLHGANYWLCTPEEDRLYPTETYLSFSRQYLKACAETPKEIDNLGTYSMGWQL